MTNDPGPEEPSPIEGLDPRDAATWPEFLTPEEVAIVLRISLDGVRRMLRSGQLPGRKTGKLWFTAKSQLLEHLRSPQGDGP